MSDTTELTTVPPGGAVAMGSAHSMLATIADAAANPQVDAGKMTALADLAMRLQDREQGQEFNRSLNAAIMAMPVISKQGQIVIPAKGQEPARVQGTFARFEDIDRVVRPVLAAHGLAIRFEVGENAQGVTVRPIISHTNGFTERGEAMRLPVDSSGAKNNTQGAGSAVSYGKRYTMCAALNIITEGADDDGQMGQANALPFERADTVRTEAEAAAERGEYDNWFRTQSPKDRAYLVDAGHHARLGDGAALPGRTLPLSATPAKQTPGAWVDGYVAAVAACASLDELMEVQTNGRKALAKLEREEPNLHRRAVSAGTDRAVELQEVAS